MGNPSQMDWGGVELVVTDIVLASTPGGAQTKLDATEIAVLDGVTAGTAAASKAVVLDASKNIATLGTIGAGVITSTGDVINGTATVTSASASALAVGLTGATNSAFKVDASTASQVAGLKVTGAATGGNVAIVTTDSGAANNLTINALGTGTIGIGSVSTGAVTITPATTVTGALTNTGLLTANGGVTLPAAKVITIGAGDATHAPINLTAGSAPLTSVTAGSVEYDGTCFYTNSVASSRQVCLSEQIATVGATPVSLSNSSTSPQAIFASANDVLQLAAATTYEFEGYFHFSTGATTHTTALGFVASSAFTSINYWAELWSITSGTISTTAASVLDVGVSTATVLNATSTAPCTVIRAKGIIRTNASSTVTPQITFSAGPTGTCQTDTNSWFRIWPIGTNTVAAVGNWS